ncbi:MAG: VOC family protein [Flavobacteriales bacterium]|jgi:predicted enzyme related to lactoylglutathione lyase|nr:VOC family protein [Flavobacteriales bacterium]
MKPNNIIYSDLSTYTPKKTMQFYENVFGWKFSNEYNYYTAYINDEPIVGLYETPDKFKQMRMPHFWMTYIQVNDANKVVSKARELGGIIEMELEMPGFGKVALIRDLHGAGFTIYEGEYLNSTRNYNTPNTLIWNELHVSDAQKIIPFYAGIFDWEIKIQDEHFFKIYNHQQEYIGDILEVPNSYKGKYEYWISSFCVNSLEKSKNDILKNGGELIVDEGNRMLMTDNSSQSFFYISELR